MIRFRIQAISATGAKRFFPAETEPRPALSAYVRGTFEKAKVPFGWIVHTTEAEFKMAQQRGARPPGFGGFGPPDFRGDPPAPDRLEIARSRARATLTRALDLSLPWYELTVNTPGADASLSKLREVVRAKLPERNRFIEDLLAAKKTEQELQIQPEHIRPFFESFMEAARPHLDEAQRNALNAWPEKLRSEDAAPFSRMINNRIDLEGAWHAVTLNAEFDLTRLSALRKIMRHFDQQRQILASQIASGQGRDNAFRDQRESADTLRHELLAALPPELSAAQVKELDAWQRQPREITVGLRAGPPPMDPPRAFAGGPPRPGGFEGPRRFSPQASAPGSFKSSFIYFDPATQKLELFDFVQVTPRKAGQKIHFLKDQPLAEMTTINLIFEGETALIVEPLAYEVYRRAGMAAPQSYQIRVWQNGQPAGYQLLVEQPNRGFLRRNRVRDDGNLYKLLWYERGVAGQHEKKINRRTGHDDIVALIESLRQSGGDAQWEIIRKNFDVAQVATYFAVNMVLSHWDGFFNNYFTYHDTAGSGKWTMYPWDQDNTWGLGIMGGGRVFHDMPITFGMNSDSAGRSGPGFGGWWRPPGWFSGPLLANPTFRNIFLARTKDILQNVYTEKTFNPIIDAMEECLQDEVKVQSEIFKRDASRALQTLKRNFDGCREHLRKRREFLLAEDEIKSAGQFSEMKW